MNQLQQRFLQIRQLQIEFTVHHNPKNLHLHKCRIFKSMQNALEGKFDDQLFMNWKKVFLKDICKPKQWKTISSADLKDKGFPVYGANGKIGFYDKYTHEHETLLITCRGATCGTMNICEPKSYVNGNAMALDELSTDANLKFVFHFLYNRGFKDVISGSAQPQITGQGLSKIQIPLPDFQTQKHIASILDKADALRQQNLQLLAHYDALLQSTFIEMFGDLTLEKVKLVKLETLSLVQGGLQVSAETRRNLPLKVPYLRVANVYRNQLNLSEIKDIELTEDELKRSRLLKEDILIVEGHGNKSEIGRAAIWDGSINPVVHQNHLIRVRPNIDQVSSTFLCYFINSESGRRQLIGSSNTTSGLNTISTGKVKNILLPVPPISIQQYFAKTVEEIEKQKEQAKQSLTESEALFQGLLSNYFGDN